jgi:ubiquinone biosynthesis protein UbiJ
LTIDLPTLSLFAGMICSVIMSVGIIAGWLRGYAAGVKTKIETVEREAHLGVAAADARARASEEIIAKSLADHKLFAAEHYATEDGLAKALDPLRQALDRMSDRLDKLLADRRAERVP